MSEYNPDNEPHGPEDDKYFDCCYCNRSQAYSDCLDAEYNCCNTCCKEIEEEKNENTI